MKQIVTIILILNSVLAFSQAEFSFDDKVHRFPKTPQGEVLMHDFQFTNTGDQPLIISNIKVACTCTKFEFPKEPIPPGGNGVIKVIFETKDAIGFQDRTLEIFSNAEQSPYTIRFKVVVDTKH